MTPAQNHAVRQIMDTLQRERRILNAAVQHQQPDRVAASAGRLAEVSRNLLALVADDLPDGPGGTSLEILHERYPDDACVVTVHIDGRPVRHADVTYVDVDPGRGHTPEEWAEAREDQANSECYTESFKEAVLSAYDRH